MNFLKEVVIGDHYLRNDVVEFHVCSEGAVQLDSPIFKHAAGGIALWDSSGTEGKFVLWKTKDNELYLHEHSLACNQSTKSRKYIFGNEILLPEVYLREFDNNLVVLAATNCAVYRICFSCQRSQTRRMSSRLPSNFLDHQHTNLFSFVYAPDLGSHQVLSAAFYHHSSNKSSFVLSCSKAFVIRIEMSESGSSSVVKKSFAPNFAVNFLCRKKSHSTISSIVILPSEKFSHIILGLDPCGTLHGITLFGLNHHLEQDLSTFLPFHSQLMVPEQTPNHALKKMAPGCEKSKGDHTMLVAYLQYEHVRCFLLLVLLEKQSKVECLSCAQIGGMSGHELVDFCATPDTLYSIWESSGHCKVKFMHYNRSSVWNTLCMSTIPRSVVVTDGHCDVQKVFLDYIMSGVFPTNTLIDVAMEMRSRQQNDNITEVISSRKDLRRAIIDCVEAEIQTNLLNYELQHEEYRKVLIDHWQQFYSLLHEQYLADLRPIGFVMGVAAGHLSALVCREAVSFLLPLDPAEQVLHCSRLTANERKLSLASLPKNVTLAQYNTFLNYIATVSTIVLEYGIDEYICTELCKGKPTRVVVESCFKMYKEALSEKENKQLKEIHSACVSWETLPDLLRHICGVITSTFVSTEDVAEANLDDFSFIVGTKYSDRLFRMSVAQNVLSTVDSSHALACSLALLVGSLGEKMPRNVQVLYQEEICSHLYNLTALKWVVHQEIATHSSSNDDQSLLLSNTGSNRLFQADETMMATFGDITLNTAKETKFSNCETKCKLVKTTLLTDFIDCSLDEIIHANISRKPSMQNQKNLATLICAVSSDILKQLCPAGSLVPFAKYLTDPTLAAFNPVVILQYCQILDQEFNLDAIHLYLRFKSYLELNQPKKALEVCHKLISRNVGFDQLLKLRQLDDVFKLKLDLIVTFEEQNYFEEAVKLLSLLCDQFTSAFNSGKKPTMNSDTKEHTSSFYTVVWTKKFKCCLETEDFLGCYDCLFEIKKLSQTVFKDCLQCWVVALSSTRHQKGLTSFNCAFMEDEIVDILEKKARSSNVLTQRFYQTLYSFHISYKMYRSAAVVMLERACRLQNEIDSSVAEDSLRAEVASWSKCYLCLDSCPKEDQRLIMPTFEYYSKDQNGAFNRVEDLKSVSKEGSSVCSVKCIRLISLEDVHRLHYICRMKNELLDAGLEKELLSTTITNQNLMLLLVKHGFFTRAITLCEVCDLDASVVFETMTNMYCKSPAHRTTATAAKKGRTTASEWVNRNDLNLDVIMATYNDDKLMLLIKDCLENRIRHLQRSSQKKYCCAVLESMLHNRKEPPFWLNTMIQRMDPMKLSEIYLRFGYLFMSVRFAKSHLEDNITQLQTGNPDEDQNLYTNPKLYMALFSVLSKRDEDAESRIVLEELKQLWRSYLDRL